jgi:type IV pilus assembly protein PilW
MSLVEILIGVLIGMIGIVIIFQVLQVSEERKRTTGAGSDAQISGSIGIYNLHRDLMLAGYGFGTVPSPYMGCSVAAYDTARPTPNFTFTLSPILITDGAGGAPDTITVLYGNSNMVAVPQTFDTATGTSKHTQGRSGFQLGDVVIISNSTPACALAQITGNTNADGVTVDHASANYVSFYTNVSTPARYNPAASPIATGQGFLYNLGPTPRRNVWRIQGDKLTWTDDLHWTDTNADGANDPVEVATGVINLQAQYGIDGVNGFPVDAQIAPSTPTSPGEWTNTPPADWTKVRAIRMALLARSGQYEKTKVTTTVPSWSGGAFVMTNVDGTADTTPDNPNDWRHYRYRVYEVVVPLRNMVWGTL